MKVQILICLCIGSALALPSNEITPSPELKHVAIEQHAIVPEANPLPVRSVEQLVPEEHLSDGAKESLEPAATGWGGYGARIGWGGYGGYGGYGIRSYGGYGGYGSGWGGYGYQPHGRYYGGYW